MTVQKPSWDYVLPLWWAFFWRTSLFGFFVGLVLGFIGGVASAMLGVPKAGAMVGGILGWAGSIPVSIAVFRHVLGKEYKSFAVQIAPTDSLTQVQG